MLPVFCPAQATPWARVESRMRPVDSSAQSVCPARGAGAGRIVVGEGLADLPEHVLRHIAPIAGQYTEPLEPPPDPALHLLGEHARDSALSRHGLAGSRRGTGRRRARCPAESGAEAPAAGHERDRRPLRRDGGEGQPHEEEDRDRNAGEDSGGERRDHGFRSGAGREASRATRIESSAEATAHPLAVGRRWRGSRGRPRAWAATR